MKLQFKKEVGHPIKVEHVIDGNENEFSYVELIESLMSSRKLETPNIIGDFSAAEMKSIHSMVSHINSEINDSTEVDEENVDGELHSGEILDQESETSD